MNRQWKVFKTVFIAQVIIIGTLALMVTTIGCVTVNPQYKGDTAQRTTDAACSDAGILMVCLYRGFEKDTSEIDCYECSKKGRDPNLVPDGSHKR